MVGTRIHSRLFHCLLWLFTQLMSVKSITLSHISSAAGGCVTMTTVLSVILRRFWSNRFSVSASSAKVASSSSSIGLSENIALAIAILSICPSDKPVPHSPSRVSMPPLSSDTILSAQAIQSCRTVLWWSASREISVPRAVRWWGSTAQAIPYDRAFRQSCTALQSNTRLLRASPFLPLSGQLMLWPRLLPPSRAGQAEVRLWGTASAFLPLCGVVWVRSIGFRSFDCFISFRLVSVFLLTKRIGCVIISKEKMKSNLSVILYAT